MDLDSLFKRAFDGFGDDPVPSGFPGVPGDGLTTGNGEVYDFSAISRCSRGSRSENGGIGPDDLISKKREIFSAADRAREVPSKSPGNTGTPGNEAKSAAISTPLQFPVEDEEPGTPGTDRGSLPASLPDLNRAAPQRSDWWTGPAMAEVDALVSPAGEPLPISAAEVHAGVDREFWALTGRGVMPDEAELRAVAIVRAKIGNSPALAECQTNSGRCHACGAPLRDDEAAVAVLNPGGAPLHLHAACHETHRARRRALVDRIMRAAGYGAANDGESL